MKHDNNRPLFVELKGALVNTDISVESCLLYIKKNPFGILKIIWWLFGGVNKLNEELSRRIMPNPKLLPYSKDVLNLINDARKSDREVYLVTGGNQRVAESIAEYLGLFTSAVGSNLDRNLKGETKLDAIRTIIGDKTFDYIGSSYSDLPVLKASHTAIICSNSAKLKKKLMAGDKNEQVILDQGKTEIYFWIKALRVYQWSKNILLFLALFMSHQILEWNLFFKSIIAFFAFSFIASSVYILNDLFDLEADRLHPTKKARPFASGKITAAQGLSAVPVLIAAGFILSGINLPNLHTFTLLGYFLATTSYSLYLKEILFVDVILLGALYTLRILAGGFATGIEVSSWLVGFSGFFFLSLAFMKRYTDLMLFKQNSQEELFGRGYNISDTDFVQKAGIASGFVSLLILALYITSEQVLLLYSKPALLWLAIPLILYWIMNMWYNTHKGKMSDDPIIYAIKDKSSYVVFVLVLVIIITATIL